MPDGVRYRWAAAPSGGAFSGVLVLEEQYDEGGAWRLVEMVSAGGVWTAGERTDTRAAVPEGASVRWRIVDTTPAASGSVEVSLWA